MDEKDAENKGQDEIKSQMLEPTFLWFLTETARIACGFLFGRILSCIWNWLFKKKTDVDKEGLKK